MERSVQACFIEKVFKLLGKLDLMKISFFRHLLGMHKCTSIKFVLYFVPVRKYKSYTWPIECTQRRCSSVSGYRGVMLALKKADWGAEDFRCLFSFCFLSMC